MSNIEIIEYLARQLNEVTAERNAAIADLADALDGDLAMCQYCKKRGDSDLCDCVGWIGKTGFEWRGIKK